MSSNECGVGNSVFLALQFSLLLDISPKVVQLLGPELDNSKLNYVWMYFMIIDRLSVPNDNYYWNSVL